MATNIESYLPPNYVKDGSVDYTAYLQKALDENPVLIFPAFPLMVNEKGLIIPSNRDINFIKGSQLIMKPTSKGSYNVIRIQKTKNVALHNPLIIGDRNNHLGTSGEWGHGIAIYGSSNVVINNAVVQSCWGDGIYLASTDGVTNNNITINKPICQGNRRNGIAITSVNGLLLDSPTCTYTDGISPMCGIDIEPSFSTDEIQHVVIINPKTERNTNYGIQIGMRSLFGGANKIIGVKIIGHADKYSKAALKVSATLTRLKGNETVTGPIDIINPFWRRNSVAPMQVNLLTKDIKLNIVNPAVQDANGVNMNDTQIEALLTKKTTINRDANYALAF